VLKRKLRGFRLIVLPGGALRLRGEPEESNRIMIEWLAASRRPLPIRVTARNASVPRRAKSTAANTTLIAQDLSQHLNATQQYMATTTYSESSTANRPPW